MKQEPGRLTRAHIQPLWLCGILFAALHVCQRSWFALFVLRTGQLGSLWPQLMTRQGTNVPLGFQLVFWGQNVSSLPIPGLPRCIFKHFSPLSRAAGAESRRQGSDPDPKMRMTMGRSSPLLAARIFTQKLSPAAPCSYFPCLKVVTSL